jgi:hypothetical protein
LDADHDLKINDALNVVTKMERFVCSTKIRIKVVAFKHLVGDTTQNEWFSRQLPLRPTAQRSEISTQIVQLNSRFDYNGSLFKVASIDDNQQVSAVCLWGQQVGIQLTFPLELVRELVSDKRG